MQLGRFHPVALPVWGEIATFCAAIAPRMARPANAVDQRAELA
jgi:pyruvate oxidase